MLIRAGFDGGAISRVCLIWCADQGQKLAPMLCRCCAREANTALTLWSRLGSNQSPRRA